MTGGTEAEVEAEAERVVGLLFECAGGNEGE